MTDNVITTTTTATNGDLYFYSVGLADHHLPELILIVGPDHTAANSIAPLFAALVQHKIASANAGVQIDNDEIVNVPGFGIRARLHTVTPHPDYPMPKFVARYGFEPPMLTEVTLETRNDA